MRDEFRHAFCFFAHTWFVFVPQTQFCHPFGVVFLHYFCCVLSACSAV